MHIVGLYKQKYYHMFNVPVNMQFHPIIGSLMQMCFINHKEHITAQEHQINTSRRKKWHLDNINKTKTKYTPLIFQADSNVMVAANSQGTIKVLELV